MLHFAKITTLLCLFPSTKADECSPENIDWSPGERTNKAIDNCDLLRDEMTIHFDRLTKRLNCLTEVKVKINSYPEWYLSRKPDTRMYQRTHSFRNFISQGSDGISQDGDRCSTVNVRIAAKVFSNGQRQKYEAHFSLNAEACTKVKDGVEFVEKCSFLADADSIQSSTDKNNSTGNQEKSDEATSLTFFLIVGGSGTGAKQ